MREAGGGGHTSVMPLAWVGDNGQGGFSAWVDFDDPGPFSYRQGPNDVPLADALLWARRQAARVILRVGDVHYSAGEEQAGAGRSGRKMSARPVLSRAAQSRSSGGESRRVSLGCVRTAKPSRSDLLMRSKEIRALPMER